MGIFLAHGQPVQSDDLAEQYSNKPFGKVFEALELLRQRLMPCFQAVSDPFPMDRTQSRSGGASISLKTLDRIKAMRAEGKKHKEIAAALGVSLATVYRKLGPVV